jgi:hypothetical protein
MAVSNTYLTYHELLLATPDPYLGHEAALLVAHGEANGSTPQECLTLALDSRGVSLFLVGDATTSKPAVIVAPFRYLNLPGVVDPHGGGTYGLIGDVEATQPLPNALAFGSDWFHLAAQTTVPTIGAMGASWGTTGAAENYLPVFQAGDADTDQVRCRKCTPIPHTFAPGILAAYTADILTWRWIWATIGEPTAVDPVQLGQYELFLNYVRVASTQRAQVANPAVGAPLLRAPETARPVQPVNTRGELGRQVTGQLYGHLQGHRQANGVGQQLQLIAQGQQLQANQQNEVRTLDAKHSTLANNMRGFSEVTSTENLAPFYKVDVPITKPSAWTAQVEQRLEQEANKLSLMAPLVNLALVNDIGYGRMISGGIDNWARGAVSIFRIRTHGTSDATKMDDQNLMYSIIASGQATNHLNAESLLLQ